METVTGKTDSLIELLAAELADMIVPAAQVGPGDFLVSGRNPRIRELLIQFAAEIKREAIEP